MKKALDVLCKIGMGILITMVLIPVLIFSLYIIGPVMNDISAKEALKEIKEIPLPEKTKIVDEISLAGKFSGNGNSIQYFGAIWIKSELPLWELEGYYSEYNYSVKEQVSQNINVIEHGKYKFDARKTDGAHYIVYFWENADGFFSLFDLRGH